jgi:PKD domain
MSLKTQLGDVQDALIASLNAAEALVAKLQRCVMIRDIKALWIEENDAYTAAMGDLSTAFYAIAYPEVTIDEVVYQLVMPDINYNGVVYSAEDLVADVEEGDGLIAGALLEAVSGILKRKVVAAFTADTWVGSQPFTVHFTDTSTGDEIESWFWEFGDGGTSTLQSPSHLFTSNSTRTVTLTVTGKFSSGIAENYIND